MKTLLTDRTVQTLAYSGKPQTIWDTNLKGFGVRIMQTRKTFTVMRGQQRERITLGHYPDISLQEARKKAMVVLVTKPRTNPTQPLLDVLDEFIRLHCDKLKGGRQMVWNLKAHITPTSLHKVDRAYVQGILDTLVDRPSEANHFFQYFRTFMMWCVRRGYLEHYPLTAMTMPHKRPSRERVLTPEELKSIWQALNDDTYSTIVKLLILTGQRRGEIEHLGLEGGTATLKSTYAKNAKEHRFPVGALARSLLQKPRTWGGWSKSKAELDKKLTIAPWTLHDLRRTYATIHAQLGTPIHVIEKLLNHISGSFGGVAGIYNRFQYQAEMRHAVDSYETFIQTLLA